MLTVASDAACVDFSQHAWRPDVCVNCHRPRSEHTASSVATTASNVTAPSAAIIIGQSAESVVVIGSDQSQPPAATAAPVPNKRASTLPRKTKTPPSHPAPKPPVPESNGTSQTQHPGLTERDLKRSQSHVEQKSCSGDHGGVIVRKSHSLQTPSSVRPVGILSSKKIRGSDRKKSEEKPPSGRVAFIDASPHIIGYDGGAGNLLDDEEEDEDEDQGSADVASFSLTDEEKSFALLSLENTVWNSEADNLLHDKGKAHRHSSREFEDLSLDALFSIRHFQNLKDCDATKRHGTFPVRKRSSSTKLTLDSVFTEELESNRGGLGGVSHGSTAPDTSSPSRARTRGKARPTAIRVSTLDHPASPQPDSSAEKEDAGFDPLNDSTTAAGLHVLALLNDVLSSYGDNESSTDDAVDRDQDATHTKKTTDFEARMASVAANLDLSKQQRAKRPAPRPPSSPPPEPTVSPKKKTQNQPEPVFKMVPMGKAIMAIPPSTDIPRSALTSQQGQSLPSFDEIPDEGDRVNGDGSRAKKGITSFFKNILRRGKDSSENLESSNPEVQFAVRSEVGSSSAPSLTDGASDLLNTRKMSDAGKQRTPGSSGAGSAGVKGGSASTGDLPGSGIMKRSNDSDGSGDSVTSQGKMSSPPSQPKNKGLSSPKQMLKRTAAKLSPPTQHKALTPTKDQGWDAARPAVQGKPELGCAESARPTLASKKSEEKEDSPSQPTPVRRRAKSPKRIPPPAPPPSRPPPGGGGGRSGGGGGGEDSRAGNLARELEHRLKAASSPNVGAVSGVGGFGGGVVSAGGGGVGSGGSTPQLSAPKPASPAVKPPETRSEIRKSMTVPPPSPPTNKGQQISRSPPTSPTPEESDSQPGSPTDDTSNSDDSPRMTERIELPTAAPGKKGILGKLNMNRKSRAPAPPASVKRARSISDAEKRGKKINPADISNPMPVTESSHSEQRRNTYSIGDDPTSSSASSAAAQSIEKGYDDLDMPILSPLGSLENLYEAILPKEAMGPHSDKSPRALCPNVPAEGYLEPVASSSSSVASTTTTAAAAAAAATLEAAGEDGLLAGGIVASSVAGVGVVGAPVPAAKPTGKEGAGKKREIVTKLPGSQSKSKGSTGQGSTFVEPEMTEERRQLLANQPIYEEIPSLPPEPPWVDDWRHKDDADTASLTSQATQISHLSHGAPVLSPFDSPLKGALHSQTLPHPRSKPPPESSTRTVKRRGSASHGIDLDPTAVTLPQAMTSSMTSALAASSSPSWSATSPSPFMTASMTSGVLWGNTPAQPVDSNGELLPLPPIPQMTPRSLSKEAVTSEADSQFASSTLTRPRPVPRRRPKRPDTTGSDQYVSMNRPNMQVTLGETKVRETFARLTALNFQTLHDIYVQCERLLTLDKVALATAPHLKWADFDIYGQALHASGRCVVYNAKLRASNAACQLMVLHSRPAAEMSQSTHPSLLRPAATFADNVPFSFLTPDFIKTSQLLQNSVYDSCQARCFLAVGLFDIADSLSAHLGLLRESLSHDPASYLHVLLMTTLQLLSAMSHCLDQGFTVTETDLGDVFHVARQDLRGKVVAFLPHQRTPDVPQGEAMCGFLDKLLQEATNDFYRRDNDDEAMKEDLKQLLTTVERLRILLEPRRMDCLAQLRAVVEYTLWGPNQLGLDTTPMPLSTATAGVDHSESLDGSGGECEASSVEQDHCAWLERERAAMVSRFAASLDGLTQGVALDHFYHLKFLLKSSATSLAECWRRLN